MALRMIYFGERLFPFVLFLSLLAAFEVSQKGHLILAIVPPPILSR